MTDSTEHHVDTTSQFYAPGLMDLSPYRMEKVALDAAWDGFVNTSPQGGIFSLGVFLRALDAKIDCWACYKKNEHRGAAVIVTSADGSESIDHRMVIHNGFLLAPPKPKQNRAQGMSEDFRTICFMVNAISKQYSQVRLKLHWNFPDIRPFLWHNYSGGGPQYRPTVRYTSLLELTAEDAVVNPESCPLYHSINKSRRQEIRYGLAKGVTTDTNTDIDLFTTFYVRTFERQGAAPENELDELRSVISALDGDERLRMFVSRTREGVESSIAVFGLDACGATYLYGANNPDLRDSHSGTMVLWDALRALAAEGVRHVNLEGVNSPARGYFKLSFGGTLTPYFHVALPPADSTPA